MRSCNVRREQLEMPTGSGSSLDALGGAVALQTDLQVPSGQNPECDNIFSLSIAQSLLFSLCSRGRTPPGSASGQVWPPGVGS